MKFGVVVFPGSNCDHDCFYVIKDVLKEKVNYLWHNERNLDNYDCIVLPGGFSYGDYLRAGAIAKFSPIVSSVKKFAHKGGIVIGVCNGFQILLEAGLLPGAMLRNDNIHFICKYVYLKTENNSTAFTNLCREKEVLKIPIAHNEGNYYIDEQGREELYANNQIIFKYCDKKGVVSTASNPNGALDNIAGIINKGANVLGMMPHPERSMEEALGSSDGFLIFNSIIKWIKGKR